MLALQISPEPGRRNLDAARGPQAAARLQKNKARVDNQRTSATCSPWGMLDTEHRISVCPGVPHTARHIRIVNAMTKSRMTSNGLGDFGLVNEVSQVVEEETRRQEMRTAYVDVEVRHLPCERSRYPTLCARKAANKKDHQHILGWCTRLGAHGACFHQRTRRRSSAVAACIMFARSRTNLHSGLRDMGACREQRILLKDATYRL